MPRSGGIHIQSYRKLIEKLPATISRWKSASAVPAGNQGTKSLPHHVACPRKAFPPEGTTNQTSGASPRKCQSFEEIPGPKGLPLIGVSHKYLPFGEYDARDIYKAFTRKYNKFGPVVKEILNGVTLVHLFDPKDFETLLRNEGKYPFRGYVNGIMKHREDRHLPPGLMNMKGEDWYRVRSVVAKEMLIPAKVASYLEGQGPVGEDLSKYIQQHRNHNGEVENFLNVLYRWVMEFKKSHGNYKILLLMIGNFIFYWKRDVSAEVDRKLAWTGCCFIDAIGEFMKALNKTVYFWPLHKSGKTKTWKTLCSSMDVIWEFSHKHFNNCLSNNNGTQGNISSCLVNKPNISRDEAITMTNDFFFAAVDTTAHSLGFLLFHLARNPDTQDKLYREIQSVLANQDYISKEVLAKMPYLKAVVKESVRLCPVIGSIVRVLDRDMILGGYLCPEGTKVMAHSNFTSRSETYFPRADSFLPERWLRSNTELREGSNPFAYLPFGHGGRACVGRRFAEQVMYLATTKIIQNYKVEYHHEDIGMATRTVMKPNKPLKFSFLDRNN